LLRGLGALARNIVGIDISSSDSVFTWYDDGAFSVGTPTVLDFAVTTITRRRPASAPRTSWLRTETNQGEEEGFNAGFGFWVHP
jgi:hypothetical protein